MGEIVYGPFTVRASGCVSQEILGADGQVLVWTIDAWIAQVICKLLTENEGLLLLKNNDHGQQQVM